MATITSKENLTVGAFGAAWAVFDCGLPIATFATKREAREAWAALLAA